MTDFVKIGEVRELDAAGQFSRWVGNHDILVCRHDGAIRAFSNICPHFGGPVGYHRMRNGTFTCLWHNLRFDAATGQCRTVAKFRLREYRLRIEAGAIYALLVEHPGAEPAGRDRVPAGTARPEKARTAP